MQPEWQSMMQNTASSDAEDVFEFFPFSCVQRRCKSLFSDKHVMKLILRLKLLGLVFDCSGDSESQEVCYHLTGV